MRIEVDKESFENKTMAKERGWYRKHFYCTNCNSLIKTETWDKNYMFGEGTILKDNTTPKFCPNCGKQLVS